MRAIVQCYCFRPCWDCTAQRILFSILLKAVKENISCLVGLGHCGYPLSTGKCTALVVAWWGLVVVLEQKGSICLCMSESKKKYEQERK